MARIVLIIISLLLVGAIVAIGILVAKYTKSKHNLSNCKSTLSNCEGLLSNCKATPSQYSLHCADTATTKDDKYTVTCTSGKKTMYGKNLVQLANLAKFTHGNQTFHCNC
uniref:Transmembrane protein n=1 Tax=Iridovirus LCIVAC01 TaxID=2506607 RepID=A0A481YQW5_9VIRU|nr:MAG: hypothetical protein LCIVAC01_01160 [Iridovirus LCIVAC01]